MRIRRGAYAVIAVVGCWFTRSHRSCQNVRWVWQFTRPKLCIFEDAGRIAIGLRHVDVLSSFSFFVRLLLVLRCVASEVQEARWQYFSGQSPGEIPVSSSLFSFFFHLVQFRPVRFIALLASKSIPKRRPWRAGDQNDYSIYGWTCDICGEWEIELTHCLARDDLYYNALLWPSGWFD